MATDFRPTQALRAIRKPGNVENDLHSEPQTSLHRDYFSLETGEPIPFDALCKRIQRRFKEIERSSVGSMLDLFFLHQNWSSFYQRQDSFTKYIRDELQISRTHAYGIINSVALLTDYFQQRGAESPDLQSFLGAVGSSLENLGVKRLIVISGIKDQGRRFSLVDKILAGEAITAEELESKIARKPRLSVQISVDGDTLRNKDKPVLQFLEGASPEFRMAVLKLTSKHFSKAETLG